MADRQDEARDHRSASTSSNAVAGLNRSVGITRLVLPGKPHMRKATVEQFRADYDNTVALYRQTVLTTFQQVEDNLASLRILAQQIEQQDTAVRSSERYLNLASDRYKLGIDSYLNVITAQTTYLVNRQTLVNLRAKHMTASVQLIEAIGGGWDASQMPSPKQVLSMQQSK